MVTVFFATFIAGSFLNQINQFINAPASVVRILGAAAPQTAAFFINYLLLLGLTSKPILFLRLPGAARLHLGALLPNPKPKQMPIPVLLLPLPLDMRVFLITAMIVGACAHGGKCMCLQHPSAGHRPVQRCPAGSWQSLSLVHAPQLQIAWVQAASQLTWWFIVLRAALVMFWIETKLSSTERAKARLWRRQYIDYGTRLAFACTC